MKGKTGKPTALRGGGLARKGVGMALKGGGMARKGTGSNAEPGGKKMADGGMSAKALPPRLGGSPNPQSDTPNRGPKGSLAGYAAQNYGGPRGPRGTPGMVRPGFPVKPGVGGPGMSGGKGGPSAGTMPQDVRSAQAIAALGGIAPNQTSVTAADIAGRPPKTGAMPPMGIKKDGGKVSKYAKGGAVKMTAGAGSGSGRLEKVAAHKGSKRVPAANLKSGGKVKGK